MFVHPTELTGLLNPVPGPPTSWNCMKTSCVCRDMHGCDGEVPGAQRGAEQWLYRSVMRFGQTTQEFADFVTLWAVSWGLVKAYIVSVRKSRQMIVIVTVTFRPFSFWISGLLCSLGLPWTYNFPTSASLMLQLQAFATIPSPEVISRSGIV